MIRDEDLRQAIDYSEGQKTAAYTVLGEIVNLLSEFSENIRIIGGWVPSLLYPESDHIGSIDVDVLLNQLNMCRECLMMWMWTFCPENMAVTAEM